MIIYIDLKRQKKEMQKIRQKWICSFLEESQDQFFGVKKAGCYSKDWLNMRMKQRLAGYKEINTPELLDKTLWEKSGHWEKFGEHMFTSVPDEKIFAVKPMNCPVYKFLTKV